MELIENSDMNIMMIISKNDRYGAQRIFLDQIAVLNALNNRIVVVGRGSDGYVPESVQAMGVEYLSIPMKGINDIFRLRQLVREREINIIHTTLDRADYFGIILSLLTRKSVISTMMVPRYHPGFKFADKIIVLSEKLKMLLLERGIKPEKVVVIRPGVNVSRFSKPDTIKRDAWKKKLGTEEYSTVFCHVASLIPRKSHQVSLDLMAACKQMGEKPLLAVVGDPLQGKYYDSLQESISHMGLRENVYFTGWISDIPEILSNSHFTLLPSENEALGIVLMEGMAAGTPIVARKGEGGAELINEYNVGFLYDGKEDIGELAKKIVAIRRDKVRYQTMSDNCRKIAAEKLSMKAFGDKLMELYRMTERNVTR
jgi:glycosyltransferase involved in cell wall biosynthesis